MLKNIYFNASIVGFLFFCIPVSLYIYNFYDGYGFSNSTEVWGVFGDYFGGVINPILSFLTLITVLYTLKSQQEEFEIVSKNSREVRKENQRQNFESVFFNYLKHLIDLINSFQKSESKMFGIDSINFVIEPGREVLYGELTKAIEKFSENGEKEIKDLVPFGILKIYTKSTRNLLKYVKESNYISELDKKFYYDVVLSQLVSAEIYYIKRALMIIDIPLYDYLNLFGFFADEFDHNSTFK